MAEKKFKTTPALSNGKELNALLIALSRGPCLFCGRVTRPAVHIIALAVMLYLEITFALPRHTYAQLQLQLYQHKCDCSPCKRD